jgi:hypothetical protein
MKNNVTIEGQRENAHWQRVAIAAVALFGVVVIVLILSNNT